MVPRLVVAAAAAEQTLEVEGVAQIRLASQGEAEVGVQQTLERDSGR